MNLSKDLSNLSLDHDTSSSLIHSGEVSSNDNTQNRNSVFEEDDDDDDDEEEFDKVNQSLSTNFSYAEDKTIHDQDAKLRAFEEIPLKDDEKRKSRRSSSAKFSHPPPPPAINSPSKQATTSETNKVPPPPKTRLSTSYKLGAINEHDHESNETPSPELIELYHNIKKCRDLRKKYQSISLQYPDQNPKNEENWEIYPPPPRPTKTNL